MAKYSKFKQKVHPIAYVIGVLFLALIAVVIIFTVPSKSEKIYRDYSNAQKGVEQFQQELIMDKNHLYKSVSVKTLEEKIESKKLVIVYIGGTWCPTCLNEIAVYSRELKKEQYKELLDKAENILYLELKSSETKDVKGLDEFFEKYEVENVLDYPMLLSFYNGKLIDAKYTPGPQRPIDIITTVSLYYDKLLEAIK